MIAYPKRESFWAHKLVRILIRTCAVNDIGPFGFMLVTIIAHTEDAKQYSDAPGYWNDQLVSQLACGSVETLDRARKKAVEHGWLHYVPGGKGRIGKYWTCIPKKFETIAPSAVDDDTHTLIRSDAEEARRIGGWKREDKHGGNEKTTAEHSNLSLSPSPIPFWLSVHAKDPAKETENRQAYADLVSSHPEAVAIGDALRFKLGRKVYVSELVEATLKAVLEKRIAAAPKPRLPDAVEAVFKLIDAKGWQVVRDAAGFACPIPDEATLRDALCANIPVCNKVINALRSVA